MAFNFNWSPLTADADFYAKARDLLTKALNKNPKPPIIVDDILVSEFNLGTVPPDLEILEIGDLAEDRFRGIFKMVYTGDAYLTLKTRVQANPLNTYLHSKPSFTSPKPLAAASGLTIPLSITLSDIKLSAFIILVFSKQKGLTLVFRNDPLESLKVSSTFDSIQFVRDYLQRTIEQQLRNLMMDELPAIIHRLSLQLWCPDQAKQQANDAAPAAAAAAANSTSPLTPTEEKGIDPFANPPDDAVDADGNLLDPSALSDLALNGGAAGEVQSLFSQKNLLRLAALTDSHRTLSLFTPGIRDVVFRAWSGPGGLGLSSSPLDVAGAATAAIGPPSLSRTQSLPAGTSTTYTFSDAGCSSPPGSHYGHHGHGHGHTPRASLLGGLHSAHSSSLSLGAMAAAPAGRTRPGRKKKKRVVNLRKAKTGAATDDSASDSVAADTASDSTSLLLDDDAPFSEPIATASIAEEPEREAALSDDGLAGSSRVRFTGRPRQHTPSSLMSELVLDQQPQKQQQPAAPVAVAAEKTLPSAAASSSSDSSVILEQAWIMKMAGEIARRVYDEKKAHPAGTWDDQPDAPPAYEAAATAAL